MTWARIVRQGQSERIIFKPESSQHTIWSLAAGDQIYCEQQRPKLRLLSHTFLPPIPYKTDCLKPDTVGTRWRNIGEFTRMCPSCISLTFAYFAQLYEHGPFLRIFN